ncbi:MAG: aspartate/glutamate racemase family protein [Dehalococcoidia bacterium]|nr:aspartate/glutamate racemase family protein [Dehalococcoidia bacterium]
MKLWIQLPSQRGKDKVQFRPYLETLEKVKRPDTEVSFQSVPAGPGLSSLDGFGYYGLRFMNDREILRNASRAPAEGFDGVVIACYFDPAVRAARQLIPLPVVGIAEASMLLANMMGLRFAVVTSDRRYVEDMVETIHLYGMEARAIAQRPVRAIGMSEGEFLACLSGNFGPLMEDFSEVARTCVQDGAQVIIAGCGLMSPALTQAGLLQVQDAPVVDPVIAGIKVAEMMVELKRAGLPVLSRRGIFEEVPSEVYERARISGLL